MGNELFWSSRALARFIFCVLILTGSLAYSKHYKLSEQEFDMILPEQWTELTNVMGTPLLLLGPLVNKRRPTIAVTPTSLNTKEFSLRQLKTYESDYRKSKEKFINEASGLILKFIPYENLKWGKDIDVHSVGVQYAIGESEFIDKTYYASCNNKMFQIKTLVMSSSSASIQSQVESIIKSLSCK